MSCTYTACLIQLKFTWVTLTSPSFVPELLKKITVVILCIYFLSHVFMKKYYEHFVRQHFNAQDLNLSIS